MRTEGLRRELEKIRGLSGKRRIRYIWDYYKWRILVTVFAILTVVTFVNMLWEGQKPCRLRVCAVLNTEDNCRSWFDDFEKAHPKEGAGTIDLNQDQPFDYDNRYYYIQEAEVMTTISSGRMDFAICNADMYSYLLALNACLSLEENLPGELFELLNDRGMLDHNTANLTVDEDGHVDPADGIDGYYALDLAGTAFDTAYDRTDEEAPLYAVIIRNTENMDDCTALLRDLAEPETDQERN